jgi:hypothetical protein
MTTDFNPEDGRRTYIRNVCNAARIHKMERTESTPICHVYIYDRLSVIANILSPCSSALLEKPPVAQLLKNFPIFYGSRRFITVFTIALHWSLS